ncbi:MAG: T9SS type A sorting domain-containing protein, partial [Ignavibacteriaceae bacterium]
PRILLNWQSNFWNQFAFKIIRKNGLPNDPSNYELISFVPQNVTQYTDSNVVIDSTYTYGVIAFNMFGYSDTSNTVSITIDPVTILKETKTISTFSLSQNYPNPFNPTTKIKYTIPSIKTRHASSLQMVTLKVYDVLGNEIATFVNEEKLAGEYEVEFTVGQDSSPDIASGIYFYRLTAGDFIQTKKMVLLR